MICKRAASVGFPHACNAVPSRCKAVGRIARFHARFAAGGGTTLLSCFPSGGSRVRSPSSALTSL
jgi:hypothetical protein